MNREQIFNDFAKHAEKDSTYYNFGQHGIIEDALAWFNIPSVIFHGAGNARHAENLKTLHDFMINTATDEQVKVIYGIVNGGAFPDISPIAEASGKVFVSMPMNKQKCSDVETIRDGIKGGLELTGNEPYFLDKDQHNGNIYNKMLEEISACRFLVSDLTTQNTGVYYEAGYAKALGKTVILTCKDSDFDNVHFDVKQLQMVVWHDSCDLKNALYARITGLGLEVKQ